MIDRNPNDWSEVDENIDYAAMETRIKRLLINLPPGHNKESTFASSFPPPCDESPACEHPRYEIIEMGFFLGRRVTKAVCTSCGHEERKFSKNALDKKRLREYKRSEQ